jgi:protein-S-isoprenylcysteine O-methyltransferase Ste14
MPEQSLASVSGASPPLSRTGHRLAGGRSVTDDGRMITRMVVQTTGSLAAMAVILCLAAGDWAWPQAWVFVGEVAVSSFAVSLWLLRHDPALLASRLSAPVQPDQMPWDRVFMAAAAVVFVSWLVLCAMDARRFAWSLVPFWAQVLGFVLIALCMIVVWQTFRFNTFAAPQIRVQTDRKQHVVTEGPYRIVRHPMYVGALLMFAGTPLLLGSWWGLLAVPVGAIGIGIRVVGEERMLRRELTGYDDYAQRVRFRMIPGLW